MGGKLSLVISVAGALVAFAVASGCKDTSSNPFVPDSGQSDAGTDYTVCEEGIIVDFSENQKVICDDLIVGVEELCGFGLTVDPCPCAAALTACVSDTAWLQLILDCRTSSVTCPEYMACLDGVGVSPSGCTDPTTWECIVSSADTDSQ